MASRTAQPEYPGPLRHPDETRGYYAPHHPPTYRHESYHSQSTEPPRPIEPWPTTRTTMPDPPISMPIRAPHPAHSDSRPTGQSLPGLRDILLPTTPLSPGYASSWGSSVHSPSVPQHGNQHFRRPSDYHSSSTLHPPSDSYASYSHQPLRRYDSPNAEQDHPRQPAPTSPYGALPDHGAQTDGRRNRHGPTHSVSHINGPTANPYVNGTVVDDAHPRPPRPIYGRTSSPALNPPGSDSQQKYIGVETTAEGTFHCYEGGLRIPTHVDGEQVNPAWGLTKANKPRKRLALACLDCREKKVKCEPGVTSCASCEKAKRQCRRSQQHPADEPATGGVWSNGSSLPPSSSSIPTPDSASAKRRPEADGPDQITPLKKPYSPYVPSNGSDASSPRTRVSAAPYSASSEPPGVAQGAMSLEDDPLVVNRSATMHLASVYCNSYDIYRVFPPRQFMHWLSTTSSKTDSERIVLYAIMAVASVFADGSLAGFGEASARLVSEAVGQRVGHSTEIALARTLLGLYYFAKGLGDLCWTHINSATTTALALRISKERGCQTAEDKIPFGLSREQLTECKRRTFWCLFVLERHELNTTCLTKLEDIYLRLPCADATFELGAPSTAPYVDNGIVPAAEAALTPYANVSPSAWLVAIAAIHSDVSDFIDRSLQRDQSSYTAEYESFYTKTNQRLRQWRKSLPEDLCYDNDHLRVSAEQCYAGIFIAMHSMHHSVGMRINRYARHAWLSPASHRRNIRMAHGHAHAQMVMLTNMHDLSSKDKHYQQPIMALAPAGPPPYIWALSSTLVLDAALMAVDVYSAGGPPLWFSYYSQLFANVPAVLYRMSQYWPCLHPAHKLCEKRYGMLGNVKRRPTTAKSGAWAKEGFGLELREICDMPLEYDCLWGVESFEIYFDAFQPETEFYGSSAVAAEFAASMADDVPRGPASAASTTSGTAIANVRGDRTLEQAASTHGWQRGSSHHITSPQHAATTRGLPTRSITGS